MIDLDALSIYTALVVMEVNEVLPLKKKDRKEASELPLLYLGEKKCLFTTEKLVFVSLFTKLFAPRKGKCL